MSRFRSCRYRARAKSAVWSVEQERCDLASQNRSRTLGTKTKTKTKTKQTLTPESLRKVRQQQFQLPNIARYRSKNSGGPAQLLLLHLACSVHIAIGFVMHTDSRVLTDLAHFIRRPGGIRNTDNGRPCHPEVLGFSTGRSRRGRVLPVVTPYTCPLSPVKRSRRQCTCLLKTGTRRLRSRRKRQRRWVHLPCCDRSSLC
jgi:hypothetical protein